MLEFILSNNANYSILDFALLSAIQLDKRRKLENLIAETYPNIHDAIPKYPIVKIIKFAKNDAVNTDYSITLYYITPEKALTKNSMNAFDIALKIANAEQNQNSFEHERYEITEYNKLYAMAMALRIANRLLNPINNCINNLMNKPKNNTISHNAYTPHTPYTHHQNRVETNRIQTIKALSKSIIGYLYIASCFHEISSDSKTVIGARFLTSLYSLLNNREKELIAIPMQKGLEELNLKHIAFSLKNYVQDILY